MKSEIPNNKKLNAAQMEKRRYWRCFNALIAKARAITTHMMPSQRLKILSISTYFVRPEIAANNALSPYPFGMLRAISQF